MVQNVSVLNSFHYQYSLKFVGFSFGGLLALQVTASLWKSPLLTEDNLKRNVACITFGQPLIHLPLVSEVAEEMPNFKLSLCSFFVHDDVIPVLMRFLNQDVDKKCAKAVFENQQFTTVYVSGCAFEVCQYY